jgi:integrase
MEIKEDLYYRETKYQKKRYLENCRFEEPTREVIDKWFRMSNVVESKENTDLANFNRKQVMNLYKNFNSKSKHTLITVSLYFSDYYNWCISEGLIDSRSFINQYDIKMVKSIIDEIIPIELISDKVITKNDIINVYLEKVPDVSNKLLLYAPFCGVYGNEASDLVLLKIEDIDENNKTVRLNSSKVLNVDDLFVELAKKANEAKKYMPEGVAGEVRAIRPERYVYDESDYIIKACDTGKKDTPASYKMILARYSLIQKQTENRSINGNNLYKSGLVNYVKEKFNERGITLKKAVYDKYSGRNYTYSSDIQEYINEFGSNMNDRMFRLRFGEYLDLYE